MDDAVFSSKIGPGIGNEPSRNRRRIDPAERRSLDQALALRLGRLGIDPWTTKITDMIDLETREEFRDLSPLREHWIFAGPTKRRAATFNTLFTAFHAHSNTSGFRGYVVRPAPAKAKLGTLAEAVKEVTKTYGRVMASSKRDGLANPVAVVVHLRWDLDLHLWDVHLHCIADVAPAMEDRFFIRLALNFSTPKAIENIKNMEAWANYCASWVVDHRHIASWPDEAVKEFWGLNAPQLIRKTGDLALFAKAMKGKTMRWEGDAVVMKDKEPRQTRQKGPGHPSRDSRQVGYAVVMIGGRRRYCAILRYNRPRPGDDTEPMHRPTTAAYVYPATTTGSIPSTPTRQRLARLVAHRPPHRMALWTAIWPYATPGRLPRPIRRRIAKAGVVVDPRPLGRPWRQ